VLVTAGCAMRVDLMPLVIVTMFSEHQVDDLRVLLSGFDLLLASEQRYALILDATHSRRPADAHARRFVAEWCLANHRSAARLNVGTTILGASALFRGALRSVTWLAPFPSPLHFCDSLPDAVAFSTQRLAATKVPLTAAARRFVQQTVLHAEHHAQV
jgi:hypothetical protein